MIKLKVLFIGKEKRKDKLSIIVERQIESLKKIQNNFEINKHIIKGRGLSGYLNSFLQVWRKAKAVHLIHANYSFTGVLAVVGKRNAKTVVSFMGDDVYSNLIIHRIVRSYVLKRADCIIVKSNKMKSLLKARKNIRVIPNGINLNSFKPLDSKICKNTLNWKLDKIHILFPSNKNRIEKNFPLAEALIKEIKKKYPVELHCLSNIEPQDVITYLNAADIVLITSKWEGSSNVTKEAMACNTVVVSTDVGDTSELFGNVSGYFIANHSFENVLEKLERAIQFTKNSVPEGRKRLLEIGMDDETIAQRILNIYSDLTK